MVKHLMCPACGERREMKAIRKATHTFLALVMLAIAVVCVVGGPLGWVGTFAFGLMFLYFGSKSTNLWRCKTCGHTMPR